MSTPYFCPISDYIFEPPNEARKVKFKKLFAAVHGGKVLDIGCGYSGLYWALSYVQRVEEIYLYEANPQYLQRLQEMLDMLSPSFLEEYFGDTITYLKEIHLITPDTEYSALAEELLTKIVSVEAHSFLEPLPVTDFDTIISMEAIECVDTAEELSTALDVLYEGLAEGGKCMGVMLSYGEVTEMTRAMIAAKVEGAVNPTGEQVAALLATAGFAEQTVEEVVFPELGHRSHYIYFTGEKHGA